jgi:lysophospholipase L1-like esterase
MKIEKGSKLVMIGDSITDCQRARPLGEGYPDGLGRGYVSMVDAMLGACCPDRQIRVVNMGVGGDTVRMLKARWQQDVIKVKPDWLSIMIGTNDVWRQFDAPDKPEKHVYIDEFERTLEELIVGTKKQLKGLVLMTPFFIEPSTADAMRAMIDRYGMVVKKLAAKYGTILVDTQAAFDDVLKRRDSSTLSADRVHPNQAGHMILARAFAKAVELPW